MMRDGYPLGIRTKEAQAGDNFFVKPSTNPQICHSHQNFGEGKHRKGDVAWRTTRNSETNEVNGEGQLLGVVNDVSRSSPQKTKSCRKTHPDKIVKNDSR